MKKTRTLAILAVLIIIATAAVYKKHFTTTPLNPNTEIKVNHSIKDAETGGVALTDVDKDGDFDIIKVFTDGVRFIENDGTGNKIDRGLIETFEIPIPKEKIKKTAVLVGYADNNEMLDMIILMPGGIRVINDINLKINKGSA